MAEYLILIYDNEEPEPPQAGEQVSAPYREFMSRRGGALRGGAALDRASTATSVRRDEAGGFLLTDGVFAESKEILGGYFVIEAADLDEALEIAREVPTVRGGVEVRPIALRS